jgi:zinc transporter, ZIP family
VSELLLVAGLAAAASIVGGALALLRKPSSLTMSVVFGFASGALIGAVTLEMLPEALALASLGLVAAGFAAGFVVVWLFDLYENRWRLAGEHAAQFARVEAYHRAHRPRGDRLTVLAAGTSAEELIEGLAIGASAAVDPELGLIVAAAIGVDNLSEGLSIGVMAMSSKRPSRRSPRGRALAWSGLLGASLFVSALIGYLLLRDVSAGVLGCLLAGGAGGMLYLTVSALALPAEEQQYQGSGALATGLGFLAVLALTSIA